MTTADAVARFAAEWQRSLRDDRQPPRIADYVPDGAQARLAVLADLLRIDLRRRWERAGLGKRIAEYRAEFPEVEHSPDFADLVCEEFLARRARESLTVTDFLAEYPDLAADIRERLADVADEISGDAESSTAVAALADLAPGRRIDDFDLLTDLGAGVLGRVFLARQRSMQRLVAVRFSAGRAGAPRTMAQLDHPHIVRVFDQRVLRADTGLATSGRPAGPAAATGSTRGAEPREADATAVRTLDLGSAPPDASSPEDRGGADVTAVETVSEPSTIGQQIGARPDRSREDTTVLAGIPDSDKTLPSRQTRTTSLAAPGSADQTLPDRQNPDTLVTEPTTDQTLPDQQNPDTLVTEPTSTEETAPYRRTKRADLTEPGGGAPDRMPEHFTGPLPRLVYMQYLPGGTAVNLLDQRRHDSVADGGALLLRAVDAAMERKGEIRPSDSSVRAEIAALSWPETVAWLGRRLADALDYAEHHGILHHDIKPANVLFTAEGIPKLADFALREASPRTANQHVVQGDALRYRSPEQLAHYLDPASPPPGNASDIYSLGVLLWELLTGASPFDDPPPGERGETLAAMLAVRRDGVTAAALSRLPEGTPAALRRVLLDCLRFDPNQRWRNGSELARQLDLCLDARARDIVDPPPRSLAYRARGWLIPFAALCIGVPNVLASLYNIRLNQTLIIDRLAASDQQRFATVGLINNMIAFPVAALLLVFLTRRPLTVGYRLGRGHEFSARTMAKARRDTLQMGDWAVWVPFGFWLVAGIVWPLGLAFSGVDLPPRTYLHFLAAQVVCAAIALAYPFFPVTVYAVRSVYPQLLVRGGIGPGDERQLRSLARRANFYLGVAASVPLLSVASATFVDPADLGAVIVPVRLLSVGGIVAFVLTYRLFRLLEADLLALASAIPRR